jgi:hypothetical protein
VKLDVANGHHDGRFRLRGGYGPASPCRVEQENQRSGSARHHAQLVIVSSCRLCHEAGRCRQRIVSGWAVPAAVAEHWRAFSPATITGRAAEVNKPKAQGLGRRNRPRVEDAAVQRP